MVVLPSEALPGNGHDRSLEDAIRVDDLVPPRLKLRTVERLARLHLSVPPLSGHLNAELLLDHLDGLGLTAAGTCVRRRFEGEETTRKGDERERDRTSQHHSERSWRDRIRKTHHL